MDSSNDKEQDFLRKEQEIRAREAEIRLRELELEINQKSEQSNVDIPHYHTRKHDESPSSLKKFSKKMIKVGKFIGFTVFTITLMRIGFFLGMWLAYGLITVAIIFIGYQIFMSDSN